jgi:ribonuclease P protein component
LVGAVSVPYKTLFKRPPRLSSKEFSFWVGQNQTGRARLRVVVPKRTIKLSVQRNKVKRIAKGVFLKIKQDFINKDIILVVKKINICGAQEWKTRLLAAFQWL